MRSRRHGRMVIEIASPSFLPLSSSVCFHLVEHDSLRPSQIWLLPGPRGQLFSCIPGPTRETPAGPKLCTFVGIVPIRGQFPFGSIYALVQLHLWCSCKLVSSRTTIGLA